MLYLSRILSEHPELQEFEPLLQLIKQEAQIQQARFFRIDVQLTFPHVPPDWEDRLEQAFLQP
ncbi:hypothetical protein BegalDRAFT_1275 [Beggiatoa alba B18LD]|uniref:Uncharacterized protein n=1 Tax=Beggiatoa alba B18LD TaxID=395493 RepID=I3CEX9_9GAMM|nr:hypothetical protein [Beggiatoa alba]EIJ42172.1 hypothetical protein BegalDRAFT_1275 [Beggiatoa alba B18LD]